MPRNLFFVHHLVLEVNSFFAAIETAPIKTSFSSLRWESRHLLEEVIILVVEAGLGGPGGVGCYPPLKEIFCSLNLSHALSV